MHGRNKEQGNFLWHLYTKGEPGNLYTLVVFMLLLQLQKETIHS